MRQFVCCVILSLTFAVTDALMMSMLSKPLFYGFDFGTSGVRCCLIDVTKNIVHEDSLAWTDIKPNDSTMKMSESWEVAMDQLLERTPMKCRGEIQRICISGTSSSALIYDIDTGDVSREPRMYDFNVLQQSTSTSNDYGTRAMTAIQNVCNKGSAANAPTSTLAKVLSWNFEKKITPSERLIHQADFIIHHVISDKNKKNEEKSGTKNEAEVDQSGVKLENSVTDQIFTSDWHNALKLGYDVHTLSYSTWMINLLFEQGILSSFIPIVIEPGRTVSTVSSRLVEMGFSEKCNVVAGNFILFYFFNLI